MARTHDEVRRIESGARPAVQSAVQPAARPAVRSTGAVADTEAEAEPEDTRSPAEIEADIDRTRARLSATLDELSERLTPRELARRGGQRIKAQFVEPTTGKPRRGPVAAAVGGAGLTVGALLAVWKVRTHSS